MGTLIFGEDEDGNLLSALSQEPLTVAYLGLVG
jgi:hypothetical protein